MAAACGYVPGTHNAFMANQHEALALVLKQSTAPGSAVPGTVFYSFDLKMGTMANGGVFFVNIFAEQAGGGVIGGSGLMGPFWPANWTPYRGSFMAPAGTDFLTIQFEAVTGAVVGTMSQMHVDNADLNQGSVVPSHSTSWGRMKALYR